MENKKVVMMVAAGKALDYRKKMPSADTEEILKSIMKEVRAEKEDKISAIAAATRALKYSNEHPEAGDRKIMQMVMNELSEISDSDKD